MVTDTIADLIIQIKNAGMVRKEEVVFPYSKLRHSVAQKLRIVNYLEDVQVVGHSIDKKIVLKLAYSKDGAHKVNDVKRVSKPSCRVYMGVNEINPVKSGHGLMFLSTPKGVLTGDEARKEHVGGEVLFLIW